MINPITYTVINSSSGEAEYRGLTAVEAAQQKLWHDGGEYEMRRSPEYDTDSGDCWELFVRDTLRRDWKVVWTGYPGHTRPAMTWAADADAAFAALAKDVIYSDWRNSPEVMTDASWMTMQVELAVEEGLL